MSLDKNNIEIVAKISELSENEKEELLFSVFDILLSVSASTKPVANNKETYEMHKKPTVLLAGEKN